MIPDISDGTNFANIAFIVNEKVVVVSGWHFGMARKAWVIFFGDIFEWKESGGCGWCETFRNFDRTKEPINLKSDYRREYLIGLFWV